MLLTKKTGGCSIGEYKWPTDGSTCDVPDAFGRDLLAIDPAQFSIGSPVVVQEPVKTTPQVKGDPVL